MSDFLGINKLSDKLPEQYPFHGGRFTVIASWYTKHAGLDPKSSAVLKEIIGYLNFNNFYEPKEIRLITIAEGTGYCVRSIIRSIKDLCNKGIISSIKVNENKNMYALQRKMADEYQDYFKKTCPHKFENNKANSSTHPYLDPSPPDFRSDTQSPPVVTASHHAKCPTVTTSSLSHPNDHPIYFGSNSFGEIPTSLGMAPQTPKNENKSSDIEKEKPDTRKVENPESKSPKKVKNVISFDTKMKKRILERIISQKDDRLFINRSKRNIMIDAVSRDFSLGIILKAETYFTDHNFAMIKCNEVSIRNHLEYIKSITLNENIKNHIGSEPINSYEMPMSVIYDDMPF